MLELRRTTVVDNLKTMRWCSICRDISKNFVKARNKVDKFKMSALFDDSFKSKTLFDVVFLMILSISCSFNDEKSIKFEYVQRSFESMSTKFVEKSFEKNFLINRRVFFCFSLIKNSFERWKVEIKIWKKVSRFLTHFASF